MSENYISPQELEEKVINEIKGIFDPEIPVNIYDLGLIYDIAITEQNEVVVLMTLTSPNCPKQWDCPPKCRSVLSKSKA